MAIGRISGPMLFSNLERQGVDLAFESNLLYLDVTTRRIGIINSSPQYSLDASGNVKLSQIIIQNNKISSNVGVVDFGSNANVVISGGSLNYALVTDGNGNLSWQDISSISNTWGNISIANNTISVINTDGNLVLDANGVGAIVTSDDFYAGTIFSSNVQITGGDISANITGNINSVTADFTGNVTAPWFIGNVDGQVGNYAASLAAANSFISSTSVQLHDVNVTGNAIRSTGTGLIISANTSNPNNIVQFDSVSAFSIPAGTTAQRPPSPGPGYLRYNTDNSTIEWWSGTQWVAGASPIANQSITPDGIASTFTLDQPAEENSILVNINGTMQQPGTAYTVAGDQITFAEVPQTTDIIDIRFISAGTVSGANVTITGATTGKAIAMAIVFGG